MHLTKIGMGILLLGAWPADFTAMAQGIPMPQPLPRPRPEPAPRPTPTPPPARAVAPSAPQSQSPWRFGRAANRDWEAAVSSRLDHGITATLAIACNEGGMYSLFGRSGSPLPMPEHISRYLDQYYAGDVHIATYKDGRRTARFRPTGFHGEGDEMTPERVRALQAADYVVMEGAGRQIRFSGAGSARALHQLRSACHPAAESEGAGGNRNTKEEITADRSQSAPPALPPDIPSEFAAGTLDLQQSGGCSRTYRRGGYVHFGNLFRSRDLIGAVRMAIELGCETNLFYSVLGLAAEVYGYPEAALRYYERSIRISDNVNLGNIYEDCRTISRPGACQGFDPYSVAVQRRSYLLNSQADR